jgi:hypothetical protein
VVTTEPLCSSADPSKQTIIILNLALNGRIDFQAKELPTLHQGPINPEGVFDDQNKQDG